MLEITLYLTAPIIVLTYKVLDYLGIWDRISGRNIALLGLQRLSDTSGYPISWIFNDKKDEKEFRALLKRIIKHTKNIELLKKARLNNSPTLISTAGSPINITGLPPEWNQNEKNYYSPNQPILIGFEIKRNGNNKGFCLKGCTLGELEKWLDIEKKNRDFWLGVIVVFIFSFASICARIYIKH